MLRKISLSYRLLSHKGMYHSTTSKEYAQKVTTLMESHKYTEASETLSEMLSKIQSYKGTKDYNEVLQIQARCFNFSYDYKSAEQNFMNIVQYIKNSAEKYKSQEILDAKLDLLHQYLTSNLSKFLNLLHEIKTDHYKSASEEDKAFLHFYEALYYQLDTPKKNTPIMDPKGKKDLKPIETPVDFKSEAKKHYIYLINHFPNLGPIRYYALHNLVVMNWQTLVSLETGSDRLLNEVKYIMDPENKAELQVYLNQNLHDIIKSNLSDDHISYVAKDFVICLYVMGGLYGDFDFETLKKVIPNMINAGVPTLTCMAEILLQRKATREVGKEFLDKINENLERTKAENKMKLHLLYGAYNLDKKNYTDAVMYLKEVTKSYLQPWHEYDRAAAHQFLGLAYQKMNDMDQSVFHAEEALRMKKKIIPWHKNMTELQIPPWRHLIRQQESR